MTLDWNWFFAAFAQCGAALIGIISAFIISKLLGENDKYEYIIKELEHSSIKKNELLKKISLRHFDWHDRLNIKYDSAIEDAIREDQFSDLTDEEKLKNLFSLIPELLRVENCISYLNSRINETDSSMPSILSLTLPPKDLWDDLSKEREKIELLKVECEALIEKFILTKRDLEITRKNLSPINNTIYILSIGLLLTVIYPLHFMPMAVNELPSIGLSFKTISSNLFSLKGGLLVLLTITIESIFLYFLVIIRSLKGKYNISINSIEKSWLNIGYYSKYFH